MMGMALARYAFRREPFGAAVTTCKNSPPGAMHQRIGTGIGNFMRPLRDQSANRNMASKSPYVRGDEDHEKPCRHQFADSMLEQCRQRCLRMFGHPLRPERLLSSRAQHGLGLWRGYGCDQQAPCPEARIPG